MRLDEMMSYKKEGEFSPPLIPRIMVYGSIAKTTLFGGLSKFTGKKVIELSPRGTSATEEFPDFTTIPVDNLEDLRSKVKSIKNGLKVIKETADRLDDKDYIKRLKASKKVDGEFVLKWAKKKEYPIAAIVISEYLTINSWIFDESSEKLKANGIIGDDDKSIGSDWNVLKRDIMSEFHNLSGTDVMTAFLTGEKFPNETSGKEYLVKPDICVGQARRQIIDDLDGLFRTVNIDGKYKVMLEDTKDECRLKQKLAPTYSREKVKSEVDITGNPEAFWGYVEKMNKIKKQQNKK